MDRRKYRGTAWDRLSAIAARGAYHDHPTRWRGELLCLAYSNPLRWRSDAGVLRPLNRYILSVRSVLAIGEYNKFSTLDLPSGIFFINGQQCAVVRLLERINGSSVTSPAAPMDRRSTSLLTSDRIAANLAMLSTKITANRYADVKQSDVDGSGRSPHTTEEGSWSVWQLYGVYCRSA